MYMVRGRSPVKRVLLGPENCTPITARIGLLFSVHLTNFAYLPHNRNTETNIMDSSAEKIEAGVTKG